MTVRYAGTFLLGDIMVLIQRKRSGAFLGVGLWGVLLFGPHPAVVSAQGGPQPLRLGETIEARLSDDGPRLAEGPFQSFQFDGQVGTLYEISMRSVDFEPVLRIGRTVAGVTDYVSSGGFHDLGSTATLYYRPEVSEPYLVVAQSADGRPGGFTLSVREAAGRGTMPLELDEPASGTMEEEVVHSFQGAAGTELMITARSRDFDTVLEVGRVDGGRFVELARDDDGAGGTDSRVYFAVPSDGEYVARVRAYDPLERGGYAIAVSIPPVLPVPIALTPDRASDGELTDASPLTDDGFPFVDHSIAGSAGSRFRIQVNSSEFDTYLSVGRMEGRRFVELASNDDAPVDGLRETDSRLVFVLREPGEHIVRVRSFSEDERGEYTVIAQTMESALAEPAGGEVAVGGSVAGELTDRDAILPDGTPHQEWRFAATTGQRIEIRLSSADFDTYLEVGSGSPAGLRVLAENDDASASAGTDSRLIFTAPAAGEFIARVRSFDAEGRGAYQLNLAEAPPILERPVEGRIALGESSSGTLGEQDARLPEGIPHQLWYFSGTAGQSVQVDLSSIEFDAYLSVGRMGNGGYEELAQNDDFGDGTDARVVFVPPADGEYVIVVRPYFSDEVGRYTLRLGAAR